MTQITKQALIDHPYLVETIQHALEQIPDSYLKIRAGNAFKNDGIKYIVELITKSKQDLLRLPRFGKACLDFVVECVLKPRELELGCAVSPDFDLDKEIKDSIKIREEAGIKVGVVDLKAVAAREEFRLAGVSIIARATKFISDPRFREDLQIIIDKHQNNQHTQG